MRKFLFGLLAIILLFAAAECSSMESDASFLGDLAYRDSNEAYRYTIWLLEDTVYVPYLVLTDSYDAQETCLLVRRDTLSEYQPFHTNTRYSAYYPDSLIDYFLNDVFYGSLSEQVRQLISDTSICVTAKSSLWGGDHAEERLIRRVFLLSAYEVSGRSTGTMPKEGTPLAYFHTPERRIARSESGEAVGWWLRTPNTVYDNLVYGVDPTGSVNVGGVGGAGKSYLSGVRPAFCLPPDTPVRLMDGRYYLAIEAPASEAGNAEPLLSG